MHKLKFYILSLFFIAINNIYPDEKSKDFNYNISNTTEIQYNIIGVNNIRGVNLLQLNSALLTDKYWKNGAIEFGLWATGGIPKNHIANDILMFSNIEANNTILCSKLGYRHTIKNFDIFLGIRNINLDYFTTPYSSLFTNSSSGIYPTISFNYGVPNYPVASMGIHAEYNNRKISVKNSFYNNIKNINSDVFFKFYANPQYYGFTNTTQVMYISSKGIYALGTTLEKTAHNKINGSGFALIEQSVGKIETTELGIIGQFGLANRSRNNCYSYWGTGIIVKGIFNPSQKDVLGVNIFRAIMQEQKESAIEVTYQYPLSSIASIQPTLHLIKNNDANCLIGLMRLVINIGN